MKLSQEQIEHVAKLARLGLTEKEKEKFKKELSSILEFVEKLKEVDTSKVEPMAHAVGLENVMREDEQKPKEKGEREGILKLAPKKKGKYVKVKAVL